MRRKGAASKATPLREARRDVDIGGGGSQTPHRESAPIPNGLSRCRRQRELAHQKDRGAQAGPGFSPSGVSDAGAGGEPAALRWAFSSFFFFLASSR